MRWSRPSTSRPSATTWSPRRCSKCSWATRTSTVTIRGTGPSAASSTSPRSRASSTRTATAHGVTLHGDEIDVILGPKDYGVQDALLARITSLRDEGYRTALVTNSFREFRQTLEELLDLPQLFDVVVELVPGRGPQAVGPPVRDPPRPAGPARRPGAVPRRLRRQRRRRPRLRACARSTSPTSTPPSPSSTPCCPAPDRSARSPDGAAQRHRNSRERRRCSTRT